MPTQHRYNIYYCSAVLSAWDTHLDGARFPYSAPQLSSRMGIYHTIHSLVVNSLKARAMTYLIFILPSPSILPCSIILLTTGLKTLYQR